MSFLNSLNWMQWAALAAVPPAIVALYFLKLKRRPLEVPSTYLWSRTIEDLHVNSIWQRLRQSLLLFLQLLIVALVVLALLQPGWQGHHLSGTRLIFLVDTSASMSATDGPSGRSRLDEVKRRIDGLIDEMDRGQVAMIVSFSDVAQVEQPYTDNKRLLRTRLKAIRPTGRATNPDEALRYAAGLANPGRSGDPENAADAPTAPPQPATLYLFSDGGFDPIRDFSLGYLDPVYVPIGGEAPDNLGVVALSTERNPERPEELQAFARIENGGVTDIPGEFSLYFNDSLIDARRENVPAGQGLGLTFTLPPELGAGVLRLQIETRDDLQTDNVAYAPVNPPRQARVLLVTPGNQWLEAALLTAGAQEICRLAKTTPDQLQSEGYKRRASSGEYDLIIYDQCSPTELPESNTLFIGALPPGEEWQGKPMEQPPIVLDSDRVHPLTQLVDVTGLLVLEAFDVVPPAGGARLMEADQGALLAIAPRRGYEDAVLGFRFFGAKGEGGVELLTNWHTRRSFPVFVINVLRYLGGARAEMARQAVRPGAPVVLRSQTPVDEMRVVKPDGDRVPVQREALGAFVYSDTAAPGVYDVLEGADSTEPAQRFAVNLFSGRETRIVPEPEVDIEHEEIKATAGLEPTRRELWKWVLLGGLCVLMFEWYVYNRRVYL